MDKKPKRSMRRVENPLAPEIFVTDRPDFWLQGGNMHMTLTTGRFDHTPGNLGADSVVVGRIVMPVEVAQRLAVELFSWLDELGLRPGGTPKKGGVQ